MRIVLFVSLAVYLIFDFIESRRPRDEREELIRLKALVFSHKATMAALCLLTVSLFWQPLIPTRWFLLVMVFSALYTEMLGKLYFRWKL